MSKKKPSSLKLNPLTIAGEEGSLSSRNANFHFLHQNAHIFVYLFFFFSIERHCEDEQDMRKLVDEFHKDFTNTYERLREKARLIVKLKKSSQNVTKFPLLKKQIMTKQMNDYDEAKLW